MTKGRISLTFRHLQAPPTPQQDTELPPSQPIPPIARARRPNRILLLTDSVYGNTPTNIFDPIPNHVCIKRKEYQLTNLDKYSEEFSYTDTVILSMGVNDLSRYGHDARSLARTVSPILRRYEHQFRHCKFVFNTVQLCRDHRWLNREIEKFNNFMFDLSREISNMSFFDSDRFAKLVCRENPDMNPYASRSRGPMSSGQSDNGIHLSPRLRRLVSDELVRSIGFLSGADGARFRSCRWLRHARFHC